MTATKTWLIGTIDDGTIGHARTKRAALDALRRIHNVLSVGRIGDGDYQAYLGYPKDEYLRVVYVTREDVAKGHGLMPDCSCDKEAHLS